MRVAVEGQLWEMRAGYPVCGFAIGREILIRYVQGEYAQWADVWAAEGVLPGEASSTLQAAADVLQAACSQLGNAAAPPRGSRSSYLPPHRRDGPPPGHIDSILRQVAEAQARQRSPTPRAGVGAPVALPQHQAAVQRRRRPDGDPTPRSGLLRKRPHEAEADPQPLSPVTTRRPYRRPAEDLGPYPAAHAPWDGPPRPASPALISDTDAQDDNTAGEEEEEEQPLCEAELHMLAAACSSNMRGCKIARTTPPVPAVLEAAAVRTLQEDPACGPLGRSTTSCHALLEAFAARQPWLCAQAQAQGECPDPGYLAGFQGKLRRFAARATEEYTAFLSRPRQTRTSSHPPSAVDRAGGGRTP